jgi:hypothetical protein
MISRIEIITFQTGYDCNCDFTVTENKSFLLVRKRIMRGERGGERGRKGGRSRKSMMRGERGGERGRKGGRRERKGGREEKNGREDEEEKKEEWR